MKKYNHWLKIDGYSSDEEKQYMEIEKYLEKYPDAKITIHQYNQDLFNKAILLECNQDYDNLDMTVNSGSNSLRRLSRKPRDIKEMKNIIIINGKLENNLREEL